MLLTEKEKLEKLQKELPAIERKLHSIISKSNKRKIKDTDIFGNQAIGDTAYTLALFQVLEKNLDLLRTLWKVDARYIISPKNDGSKVTVTEFYIKGYPTIVFHGFRLNDKGSFSTTSFKNSLLKVGFDPKEVPEVEYYDEVSFERDNEAFHTTKEITLLVQEVLAILRINGVSTQKGQEILNGYLRNHSVESFNLGLFLNEQQLKKALAKREFNKAIRQLTKWGY